MAASTSPTTTAAAPAAAPVATAASWSVDGWHKLPAMQQPGYPDAAKLKEVITTIAGTPPLVQPTDVDALAAHMRSLESFSTPTPTAILKAASTTTAPPLSATAAAATTTAAAPLLLQGGDCAERFADCNPAAIDVRLRVLAVVSAIIEAGCNRRVVTVGRIAGQYAKPRSNVTELHGGRKVPVYRGDCVHGYDPADRTPDPTRLLQSYANSARTLAHIAKRTAGPGVHSSIASLDVLRKALQLVKGSPACMSTTLARVGAGIEQHFGKHSAAQAAAAAPRHNHHPRPIFTSHEGLFLPYEAALTRRVATAPTRASGSATAVAAPAGGAGGGAGVANNSRTGGAGAGAGDGCSDGDGALPAASQYYDLSAHMLWVGDRTRRPDHAHIEFFRGIANPLGIKLGPRTSAIVLTKLLQCVVPPPHRRRHGGLALITRLGAAHVHETLPTLIKAATDYGARVVWVCDPMHGNTHLIPGTKLKTRRFEDVVEEVRSTVRVLRAHGQRLGGLHLELSGDEVTECTGGPAGVTNAQVGQRYESYCDPRLSYSQSVALACVVAEVLSEPLERHTGGVPRGVGARRKRSLSEVESDSAIALPTPAAATAAAAASGHAKAHLGVARPHTLVKA